MGFFTDKISIITGAASGIGREVSEQMARRGAYVIIADIDIDLANEVAERINTAGGAGAAKPVKLDVTDHEAVKKLVDDTVAEHGRLDYIFNNAGIGVMGEVKDYTYDDWKKVIDVDLYGVVNGVAAAYPVMVAQGFGHIVNTASAAGLIPVSGLTSYVTSKFGVVGLSNALRVEGAALGVKVSVVCPGFIKTPLIDSLEYKKLDKEKMLKHGDLILCSVEKCARDILRGVEKNKQTIVVTKHAKILWMLQRFSPTLVDFFQKTGIKWSRKIYSTD